MISYGETDCDCGVQRTFSDSVPVRTRPSAAAQDAEPLLEKSTSPPYGIAAQFAATMNAPSAIAFFISLPLFVP